MGYHVAGRYQICERCEFDIAPGTEIVRWHGSWIHQLCAPGGDE